MPAVKASAGVTGVPVDRVWVVVSDAGRFPLIAEHVLDVRREPGGEVGWLVLLNGSRVGWVQREAAEPPTIRSFEQVRGDLDRLRGRWTLRPVPDGVRLDLEVDFHLGVDGLAALLDPIWSQAFQAHADALVGAVARAARSDEMGTT
jgi:Polyketide cyclase / dehydrase and lipid transport